MGAGSDFETRIMVKTKAPALLRERLMRPSWKGRTIVFSGVTDCYQPLEGRFQVTRKCLAVCAEFQQPVGIITRSPLVIRDIDILQDLAKVNAIRVMISMPLYDSNICKLLEPGAPSPKSRLRAIEKLHSAGIEVGVSISPIVPGLNVSSIPDSLRAAKDAGAQFTFIQMLRLPGSVEEVFLHRLEEQLPHLYTKVKKGIQRMRNGELNNQEFGGRMSGQGEEWNMAVKLFQLWI